MCVRAGAIQSNPFSWGPCCGKTHTELADSFPTLAGGGVIGVRETNFPKPKGGGKFRPQNSFPREGTWLPRPACPGIGA